MRQEREGGLGDKGVEDVCAGISAVRDYIASDCIQFVSGIFPYAVARSGFRFQLDREQDGATRSHPGFHQLPAPREPGNRVGFSGHAWARPVEVRTRRMAGNAFGRVAGDEAVDGGYPPDLRGCRAYWLHAPPVEGPVAAFDNNGTTTPGRNSGGVWQTAEALGDARIREEDPGAWNLAGVLPCCRNDPGDAGVDGDLLGSEAKGRKSGGRTAGRHAGNPLVVGRQCAFWLLCAKDAVQRGIWWIGGGDRIDDLDADLDGGRVPGGGMERRNGVR